MKMMKKLLKVFNEEKLEKKYFKIVHQSVMSRIDSLELKLNSE